MFECTFKSFRIGAAVVVFAIWLPEVNFARAGDIVAWGWDNWGHVSGVPAGSDFIDLAGGYYQCPNETCLIVQFRVALKKET